MTDVTLPITCYLATAVTLTSAAYAIVNVTRSWAPPFLAVLGCFAAWYLLEPFRAPDDIAGFSMRDIETAYDATALFIVAFVFLFMALRKHFMPPGAGAHRSIRETMFAADSIPPDRLAVLVVGVWLILLAYGTSRVNWDVMQALFPVDSRAGVKMWQRSAGADAGPTGFIVAMASYLYTLVLAMFGILLPIVRKISIRLVLFFIIAIAWPYAFLQGSRNVALAVSAPMFASIFLFTLTNPVIKLVIMVGGFQVLDFAFRAIISMRNTGFTVTGFAEIEEQRHLGFNMGSELMWIAHFFDENILSPSLGTGYFAEIVALVPRVIWSDKPLIGIDYAIARGYGGGDSDIGVFATISSGMIGQGVLNFGFILGPILAALLMAIWANVLHRLRVQGSAPRIALFLLGLGLTFNLGRDITLLVLFPMLFGYLGVRIFEHNQNRRRQRLALR